MPFEIQLIEDYGISSMLPLATHLIKTHDKWEKKGILFEPEEERIKKLIVNPLERELAEVGQNNIVVRYCTKYDIPLHLLSSSRLREDLDYLGRNLELGASDYLGIFNQDSIDTVLDFLYSSGDIDTVVIS